MSLKLQGNHTPDEVTPLDSSVSISSLQHDHHEEGTIIGTTMNTLCNVMGAGVLSLPYAMYNGSVIISLILLIICSILASFAVYALVYSSEVTNKFSYTECLAFTLFPDQPLSTETECVENDLVEDVYDTYSETINHKRRRWVTIFMEVVVCLNNYGALVIYSRVISDSIPPVLSNFFGAKGVWVSHTLWLIAPGVIFFILSCARKMDELKWTSLIGFVTILYIVVIVVVRYFTNIESPIVENLSDTDVSWFRLSVSCCATLSTYALAFGYHFNVPYFYKELSHRTPATMMETVKNAFPIITVSYGVTGLLGYLTFGSLVASREAQGNIVNNYSDKDIAMNIGRLGLFFHFASVYPILSVCARRGVHRVICLAFTKAIRHTSDDNDVPVSLVHKYQTPPGDPSTTKFSSIVIEAFCIVSTSTVIAAFVPGIGTVVVFIGAMFGIPTMLIFPGMIGMMVFKEGIPATSNTYIRLCQYMSRVSVVVGVVFLICGLVSFGLQVS